MSGSTGMTENFDRALADECAAAFSRSTGLGCTISDASGLILYEAGYGFPSCGLCNAAKANRCHCDASHTYGVAEAERFGGKYIYFCPMGLTCFVSPICCQSERTARITVGPFLMVDMDDYIECDLVDKHNFTIPLPDAVTESLRRMSVVPPERVNSLSTLLFMAVGFINNVSESNRMRSAQASEILQRQISARISELKRGEATHMYPFAIEKSLTVAIAASNRETAQKLLNELLGYIFFSSGGDLDRIKSRVCELLVLMSRAAVDAGVSPEQSFEINHSFFTRSRDIREIEALCFLIADVLNRFTDDVFRYADIRHSEVLRKAVNYVRENYMSRLTLESVADHVYLSPSYLGKIFKQEMGESFNTWLNHLRIEKSKQFLLREDIKLVDAASMVGFEDQSYFSKVFKKVVGVSPNRFRVANGKLPQDK